jgi:hypothetical protein
MDVPGGSEVLVLGCSFTFGWGVSDDETWAWGLQAVRTDLDIRNRGTAAYSTFQALLLLERVLASGERPARVLLGYISEQAGRNVAPAYWIKLLNALSREGPVAVPYCTLDGGHRLVRHPPEPYPAWPLHRRSAAVAFLEWRWFELSGRARIVQSDEVTRLVIAEIADLCRAHAIPFSLVILHVHPAHQDVVPFARSRGIDVIDCRRSLGPADLVPGELAHPNARTHAAWATCIADGIAGLEARGGAGG